MVPSIKYVSQMKHSRGNRLEIIGREKLSWLNGSR